MALYEAKDAHWALNHSRQLDVHTWSDHPEVNKFVNVIHQTYFKGSRSLTGIQKHALKKVLIDLYVAWLQDPEMCIGFYLGSGYYRVSSRYNALKIGDKTGFIAMCLSDLDLVDVAKGFFDEQWASRNSRMKATPKLIRYFKDAKINKFDIGYVLHKPEDQRLRSYEPIIMRIKTDDGRGNELKEDVEYEDTPETIRMRGVLMDYNFMLVQHHIDLCNTDVPWVDHKKEKNQRGKPKRTYISHHDKFTHRVFNNNRWDHGGRFYGGFWQTIPSTSRPHIRISGRRTIEVDYSSHHPALLYAQRDINYWSEIGTDPYEINTDANHPVWQRKYLKDLLLIAINAKTDRKAFGAFIKEHVKGHKELHGVFTYDILGAALDALRRKHEPIADLIGTGKGIELQYLDSQITEMIITEFMAVEIPVLAVHDSYIVWEEHADDLRDVMNEAWRKLSSLPDNKLVEEVFGSDMPTAVKTKQIGYFDEEFDHEEEGGGERHLEITAIKNNEYVSQRYLDDLDSFNQWKERTFNK